VLVPMTKVRILGRRQDTDHVLSELHRLGLVEIADASADPNLLPAGSAVRGDVVGEPSPHGEELIQMRDRIDAVFASLPTKGTGFERPAPACDRSTPQDLALLRAEVDELADGWDELDRRLSKLREERVVLAGYVGSLQQLLPLVPVLAEVGTERLRQLGIATVALVLNTDQDELVDALRSELASTLGDSVELVATRAQQGSTGCLVIVPSNRRDAVQAVLGRAAVRPVALPDEFSGLSLHAAVEAMSGRLHELSATMDLVGEERLRWPLRHEHRLKSMRGAVEDRIELWRASESVGATERAFLIECWVPRRSLRALRRELGSRLGPSIVAEDTASSPHDPKAPVLMRNTRLPRPFESLVGFLGLPRPGSIDPTVLMGIFLPLMFGAMVGDVGYGVALLALALFARRRLAARAAATPEIRGLLGVLLWGSAWSVVFGCLYGEAFGDLGTRVVGDWAIWQYRASPHALAPLLIFAVVLGAAHVGLGLVLGAWQAVQFREPRVLLDKVGTIIALTGLFGLGGWAVDQLPNGALTPSAGAVVVGLVLVLSLHGSLGVVTGALDLVGRIGNILSYLRVAAVGLASAHLAGVANALGTIGPIWVGVLVAAFLHALNLALAAFSPMIQALRLNYVEFFGTFFVAGGHAFTPFGHPQRRQMSSTN
jgi:V/A-type H+/Na+-transporting ATPase subunit I